MHGMSVWFTALLALLIGFGPSATAESASRHLPPANATVDYQLGGAYRLPPGVTVVTRDRTEAPAKGAYNICYVNAFQTQPGSLSWWHHHHPGALLRDKGRLVPDPGWRGEVLLDTSTRHRRQVIGTVIGRWIRTCGKDGFDAVEPDNLDSYSRSHHLLTKADNLAAARRFAKDAHAAGLAIAQKNSAELTRRQHRVAGFDFAVAEECQVWHECGAYRAIYGKHVIEVEYTDNGRHAFHRACSDHGRSWSIVLRDRMLRTPSSSHYTYRSC